MRFMNRVFCTIFLATSSMSFAGGMISSGGELLKDAHNPWWLKNTSHVQYCIEVDTSSFSASTEMIDRFVAKALAFWKAEFTRPLKIVNNKEILNTTLNQIGVGLQDFVKIDCTGEEDLRFKFGYKTLTEEQIKFIPNLRSHLGVAVRTEYDEVSLKGRGYIYIASDSGPYSYKSDSNIIKTPWQYEIFLYLVLVHELGHVFGLPHIGESYTLMSAQFMEFILSLPTAFYLKDWKISGIPIMPFYFFPSNYFVYCSQNGLNAQAQMFLEAPWGTRCLHFGMDGDNKQIFVYVSQGVGVPGVLLGVIRNLELEPDFYLGVTLTLNPKQKVFAGVSPFLRIMAGPSFIGKKGSGTYYAASGIAKPLYIDLNSRAFNFVSWVDGALRTILAGPTKIIPSYNQ